MAGTGAATARAGWYPDPNDADGARYWDGESWTEHRAKKTAVSGPVAISWIWRLGVLSVLPWLAAEIVLLLVPWWAPDESHSTRGVIGTALGLLVFIGAPGVMLSIVTTRRSVLAVEGVVLVAIATWSAIAVVASDDAQAGLAMLSIWFAAVPVFLVTVIVEWWLRHRLTARRALP
jgi:hypothetical protein